VNDAQNLLVGMAMGLNLIGLASSRLTSLIRAAAIQGMVLGVLPLLLGHGANWWVILVAAATVVVKGFVIPALLRKALRAAHIDREVQPLIPFVPSLLLGAAATVGAVALSGLLPLRPEHAHSLLVPGSFATVVSGLLLLMGRAKAIAQVCGYLMLENGIYMFGLLLIGSITEIHPLALDTKPGVGGCLSHVGTEGSATNLNCLTSSADFLATLVVSLVAAYCPRTRGETTMGGSTSRRVTDYASWFHDVTAVEAHPWQARLGIEDACSDRLIHVPTGFGKTAGTVLPWLYHVAVSRNGQWPTRLVYVLPMRGLVEQTASAIQGWLQSAGLSIGIHVLMGDEDAKD